LAKGYIGGKNCFSLSQEDRDAILKYREEHNIHKKKRKSSDGGADSQEGESESAKLCHRQESMISRTVAEAVSEAMKNDSQVPPTQPDPGNPNADQTSQAAVAPAASLRFGRRGSQQGVASDRDQSVITSGERRAISGAKSAERKYVKGTD